MTKKNRQIQASIFLNEFNVCQFVKVLSVISKLVELNSWINLGEISMITSVLITVYRGAFVGISYMFQAGPRTN